MTPLIVFGIALTTLSIYINGEVAPKGTARRHDLLNGTTKTVDLIKLLEPGRFIKDFNGVDVWFESKDGDTLKNLLILEKTKSGENRETRCEEAILEMGDSNLTIHMRNVRITPFSDNIPGTATADSFSYVIQNVIKKKKAKVKVGDLTNSEISEKISSINHFCEIDDPGKALSSEEITKGLAFAMKKLDKSQEELTIEDRKFGYAAMAKRSKSIHLTEYNRRIAFGMAPIAFILLGMPLGIRTSRRESNIGIAISLVVMLLYYAFMLLAKTTAHHPQIFPHLIVWLPTVISVTIAAILIRKNQ